MSHQKIEDKHFQTEDASYKPQQGEYDVYNIIHINNELIQTKQDNKISRREPR